ncbi:MAG: cellulase family glycosylhydrolase [Anaerolineae bacterium]
MLTSPRGLRQRRGLLRWMSALTFAILIFSVGAGCQSGEAGALHSELPSPTALAPTKTAVPTPTPTITPYPTPTPHPTPLPTIVIPMLTQVVPTVTTPEPHPEVWSLPERVVPHPFGVEIHFTRASRQELDYLAAGGFKWVRMDLFWHTVEKTPGRYDFSEYDALVASMRQRGIRIMLILDYGNPLYDHGFPPTSPGGKAAFARFAAVAAARYRDAGILWDLWNEPNLDHFWPPKADATQYGQLALKAATAIRHADPGALIAGPAVCGYEWDYWHTLGRMGLFTKVDALSVHSYGVETPEDVIAPYLQLRSLIDQYNPLWKVPVISGEWGFASTEGGTTEVQQAQYLARQWLINLSHDIDLNIWYDWRDDGTDPTNPEHNFGTVRHDYGAKPAYRAAQTLATTLSGYRFLRRIPLARSSDYLLLFQREELVALAAWTAASAHTIVLPITVDEVNVVEMTGQTQSLVGEGEELALQLSHSPRYLHFRPDQAPTLLGGWGPEDTINTLRHHEEPTIPIVFERYVGIPFFGELQIWADGAPRGELAVNASPMVREVVRVPLRTENLRGTVPAEVRLVLDDPAMAPLHSAAIWIQIPSP